MVTLRVGIIKITKFVGSLRETVFLRVSDWMKELMNK